MLVFAQTTKSIPIVNQAGYNLDEAKRFVCYGAPDGTAFEILPAGESRSKAVFKGKIQGYSGTLPISTRRTRPENLSFGYPATVIPIRSGLPII